MSVTSYLRAMGETESRPLDIDRPRAVTFDLDSDEDVERYTALTEGEHADSYRTQMLSYDEDTNQVRAIVAPADEGPSAGDAVKEGYTVLHDLNRGRLPRQIIGDEAYDQRYGGSRSAGEAPRDDSSSTSKDVLEHMVGSALYERVKKAAS